MNGVIGPDEFFSNSRMTVDDTIAYLTTVHTLLPQCTRVLDVGCGRGSYADVEGQGPNLYDLRGAGRSVIGLDVDERAQVNPFLDGFVLLEPGGPWPVEDASIDLVVSDWTIEHVEDPRHFVRELVRVLRPGGVFVARSINRNSALSVAARTIPNGRHAGVLSKLQPHRKAVDVFPTCYRMNESKSIEVLFSDSFDYTIVWRPGLENYVAARFPRLSKGVARVERVLPQKLHTAFVLTARLRLT